MGSKNTWMPLLKPLTRLFNDEKSKTPRCIQVTVSLQLLFHHLFAPHTTSGQLGNFERMVCYLVCLCSFQQGYIWSSLLRNSTLSTIIKCRQEGEFSSVSAGHYLRNRSIIRRMSFVTSSRFCPSSLDPRCLHKEIYARGGEVGRMAFAIGLRGSVNK